MVQFMRVAADLFAQTFYSCTGRAFEKKEHVYH